MREVAKVSEECLSYKNCTMSEMIEMKDLVFALQQFDAFGKPPADLLDLNTFFEGSYEECQVVSGKKYSTSYCYLVIHFGWNATCPVHPIDTFHKLAVPRLAVCMPMSCAENDLVEVFNQMTPFPLTACEAHCAEKKIEKGWAFYGFSTFLMTMILLASSATLVDYFREREIGMSSVNERAYFLRIFLSFSLWSNSEMILSVKEHKPGYIRSLDCIRALSIVWIVSAHSYNFHFPNNILGGSIGYFGYPSVPRHLILNAFFSIDTFFILSGVVVAYLFFRSKPKRQLF
ncbi:unnamed protein product [Caenorhabditis sp. 36 PRJEB53466]|nr:unnamed protein product [Caenorhabditis sp. 36 PRJEB53466]